MSVVTDSCRVIADGDVRAIGVFKTRGHPLYRAEMLPWRPIFSTRETAMETTLAYFNSKEGGGESEDSQSRAKQYAVYMLEAARKAMTE